MQAIYSPPPSDETRPPEDNMGTDNEPNENPEDQLHQDLNQLRALNNELNNTKEPSRVSLASSLQNIIIVFPGIVREFTNSEDLIISLYVCVSCEIFSLRVSLYQFSFFSLSLSAFVTLVLLFSSFFNS